ncbi:MAG: DUF488 family protein [Dehalococcoidia bacterium]|nr:DUF488 family protein [Dehalococcoidia bacterium]
MTSRVWLRRAYDAPTRNDGYRVLVDRLWPRGVSREHLAVDEWLKEVAPSSDLRRWYDHRAERWDEFRTRYLDELASGEAAEALASLVSLARKRRVTLVYGARDAELSNAAVLREAIEARLPAGD